MLASHVPSAPSPVHTSSCVVVVGPLSPAGTCEVISLVPPLPCLWAYYPCICTQRRGHLNAYQNVRNMPATDETQANTQAHTTDGQVRPNRIHVAPCAPAHKHTHVRILQRLSLFLCCCNSYGFRGSDKPSKTRRTHRDKAIR